ncbi:hypothetical protein J6590_064250 [Homalodisca vitripennis]|nr:hypothetical protein J6590_064250 [Homalodisca vitripennis]
MQSWPGSVTVTVVTRTSAGRYCHGEGRLGLAKVVLLPCILWCMYTIHAMLCCGPDYFKRPPRVIARLCNRDRSDQNVSWSILSRWSSARCSEPQSCTAAAITATRSPSSGTVITNDWLSNWHRTHIERMAAGDHSTQLCSPGAYTGETRPRHTRPLHI